MKKNESISKGRGMDDIFIDKQPDEDYMGVGNPGEIDFFDDILNDGVQNVLFNINFRKLQWNS